MDCFEVDFQTYRAVECEIRPEPAEALGKVMQLYFGAEVPDLLAGIPEADEYRDRFRGLTRASEGFARHMDRVHQIALMAIASLPDEDRKALSSAVVSVGERSQPLRPTSRQLDHAVELLARDSVPLETAALKITRAIGNRLPGARSSNLYSWLRLRRQLANILRGRGVHYDLTAIDPPLGDRLAQKEHELLSQYHLEVGVYLIPDEHGGRRLVLRPRDETQALVLQAARRLATGTEMLFCDHCNTGFLSGGPGRGKNKRRAGARFCSDKCRWDHNNERRRK
jgi:hypothetical protein